MNVIITGASKGIGYALAKEFVKIGQYQLYLISRSKSRLQKLKDECYKINPESKVLIIPYDLRDLESENLPSELNIPHIDILINNAGLLVNKPFSELNLQDITAMIGVNYLSPVLLIQKLINRMGGKQPSHVVNISSMGGFQGSAKFSGLSIYSSTKAAVASLTECLAEEYKDRNIFFNCLALGAVQTEMLEQAFPGFKAPVEPEEMAKYIVGFAKKGYKHFNGKVLPVSVSTP
jgi:short-subunit dehydrogenase